MVVNLRAVTNDVRKQQPRLCLRTDDGFGWRFDPGRFHRWEIAVGHPGSQRNVGSEQYPADWDPNLIG